MRTTRLSTKGQIILPKEIRHARAWKPGAEFTVEEKYDGILLRPAVSFPATDLDEVAGYLRSKHKSLSSTQIQNAVSREIARRDDRGRY